MIITEKILMIITEKKKDGFQTFYWRWHHGSIQILKLSQKIIDLDWNSKLPVLRLNQYFGRKFLYNQNDSSPS